MRTWCCSAALVAAMAGLCLWSSGAQASTLYRLFVNVSAPFQSFAFVGNDELTDYGLYEESFETLVSQQVLDSGATFTIKSQDATLQGSFDPFFADPSFDFSGHAIFGADVTGAIPGHTTVTLDFDGDADSFGSPGSYSGEGADNASFTVTDLSGQAVDFASGGLEIELNASLTAVPLPAAAPLFGAALVTLGGLGYGLKRRKEAAAA